MIYNDGYSTIGDASNAAKVGYSQGLGDLLKTGVGIFKGRHIKGCYWG